MKKPLGSFNFIITINDNDRSVIAPTTIYLAIYPSSFIWLAVVRVVVDEATDAVISQATDIYNHHQQQKACQKQNAHHNTARCYKGITVPP